jgi:hypothetical protein
MANYDFSELCCHYPEVIADMPEVFGSHEFILELAKRYQKPYVEALYAYRDSAHVDSPSPFQFVHTILAQKLRDFPHLVEYVRRGRQSKDIFGTSSYCAEWRKVH